MLDFGEGSFMAELEGTLSQLQVASVGHRSVLSVVPDAAAGGGGGGGEGIEDRVIIEDESTKASDEVPLTTQPYKYDPVAYLPHRLLTPSLPYSFFTHFFLISLAFFLPPSLL